MWEVVPLVAGFLVGIGAASRLEGRARLTVVVVGGIVVGVLAALFSGELAREWEFLLFDVPLAVVAAFAGWKVHDLALGARRTAS